MILREDVKNEVIRSVRSRNAFPRAVTLTQIVHSHATRNLQP